MSVPRCTVYSFPAYRAMMSAIPLVNRDKLLEFSKDLTPWTNDLATTKQNSLRSANPTMQYSDGLFLFDISKRSCAADSLLSSTRNTTSVWLSYVGCSFGLKRAEIDAPPVTDSSVLSTDGLSLELN